jgi:eukaryotic-like serine/threonine-protein kinase
MSDSARWIELQRLYHAALERPAGERAAFVAQAAAHDEWLRRELKSLLAHDRPDDVFLDQPAIGVAARELMSGQPATPELPGEFREVPAAIGGYRILSLLGEGGMGTVYQAEQQNPHRIVALKVINPGFSSGQLLRRFEKEAEALGRLQHPGIAQIYEAGTAASSLGPQPYFAMEFIQGRSLNDYATDRRLNVRARLDLMARVCDAVNHAHQHGIIHRDLKPGNILVDETGQPKILDFGVARLMDSEAQTFQTDVGQIAGTLAYMSPEQAQGDPLAIDIRSDVYALGVILYELLAGKLPYNTNRKSLHEMLQVIREEDPAPLSSIHRTFRGDIDTIVAKALAKDKLRRYASAADLAGDIRRYLSDKPIVARPPSASYQLQKFARRHRALVAGTAAVFLALAVGVVVSTREAVRARQERNAAISERERADSEAASAKAVNDFLQNDLLAQASANNQAGSGAKPDPDLKVRTALDRAAAGIAGKFDRQPEVEAEIRQTIGQTYSDLGQYSEASKHLERALDLYRGVLGAENPKTLAVMRRLGDAVRLQGKYPQAEALLSQTLKTARRVLGPEHPDTLNAMNTLGLIYYQQGKYAPAEALLNQTVEIERRVLGPERPDTLNSMNNLANTYLQEGKYAPAETLNSQILEIRRRLLGPEHPITLTSMNNLAIDYFEQGKYPQAETLYTQTLEIRRRVLGPEHPEVLVSMQNLAGVYDQEGKYAQAEALFRQTLEIMRRVLGPEHSHTLAAMNNLASVYGQRNKYAQAETLFSQTLELMRRVQGPEHPYTLDTLSDMALIYQRQGKYDAAKKYAAECLAGRRHSLGLDNPDTMDAAADLALAYQSQGRFAESEPLAREAVETDRKTRPDDWQRFRAESLLGASLAGQKKYAEAEPLLLTGYQGMAARKDRIGAPDRYQLHRAREWIVRLYQGWDKPEKAAEWRKK